MSVTNMNKLNYCDADERHLNTFIDTIIYDAKNSDTYTYTSIDKFPIETEENNVEYKLQLIIKGTMREEKITSQLFRRLSNGQGHCVYYIGICDNGEIKGTSGKKMKESLKNIIRLVNKHKLTITNIQTFIINRMFKRSAYWGVLNIVDNNYTNVNHDLNSTGNQPE